MPRTQMVPSSGSWSFPDQSPPVSWTLPAGSAGGDISLTAITQGSTPVDGEGVIFQVDVDGAPFYTSACMETGVDIVAIPPGTLTIDVTVTRGCNGGPDVTDASVSGAGA